MTSENRLAAIDLGSNSFRLEIGVLDHGEFQRTEYIKETVRQGAGLDADRNLTAAAMQNGWDCLARFGERLAGFAPEQVRAVATQTLREARNRDVFLERANTVLGFPIDVISGREEARLIYQGVAHTLAPSDERRMVIDIGGRSTELILGQGFKPRVMESFRVGSIAWSTRYFADGQFNRRAFEIAEIAAKAVLDEALDAYHPSHWDVAYGSAGTVGAISDVLAAAGWPQGLITQESLDWLLEKLISAQSADRVKMPGMREDRKAVIGGGLSITRALFSLLGIKALHPTDGGLRHGFPRSDAQLFELCAVVHFFLRFSALAFASACSAACIPVSQRPGLVRQLICPSSRWKVAQSIASASMASCAMIASACSMDSAAQSSAST